MRKVLVCTLLLCVDGRPTGSNWMECETSSRNSSLTAELQFQLATIIDSFSACKQPIFAVWGTLIGILRNNGMNPIEKDNDIALLTPLSDQCVDELLSRGMIVFVEDGITRICRRCRVSSRTCATGLGDPRLPHTDLYTVQWIDAFLRRSQWLNPHPYYLSYQMKRVSFLNRTILIPVDAERILTIVYGNWKVPGPSHGNLGLERYFVLIAPVCGLFLVYALRMCPLYAN